MKNYKSFWSCSSQVVLPILACTGPPPEPTDSTITSDFTGSWSDMAATYSVGMEVQYSCPDGGYKYARCEADGTWWTDDPDVNL